MDCHFRIYLHRRWNCHIPSIHRALAIKFHCQVWQGERYYKGLYSSISSICWSTVVRTNMVLFCNRISKLRLLALRVNHVRNRWHRARVRASELLLFYVKQKSNIIFADGVAIACMSAASNDIDMKLIGSHPVIGWPAISKGWPPSTKGWPKHHPPTPRLACMI